MLFRRGTDEDAHGQQQGLPDGDAPGTMFPRMLLARRKRGGGHLPQHRRHLQGAEKPFWQFAGSKQYRRPGQAVTQYGRHQEPPDEDRRAISAQGKQLKSLFFAGENGKKVIDTQEKVIDSRHFQESITSQIPSVYRHSERFGDRMTDFSRETFGHLQKCVVNTIHATAKSAGSS